MKILRYISVFAITLLLAGELLCRVKLFLEKKDIYYLTAPFLQKIAVSVDKSAQEHVFVHFNNEEYRLSLKNNKLWTKWYQGDNWYYKMKPGTYASPQPHAYGNYTINKMGFRGLDFDPRNKNGKVRIFCVGDSNTIGLACPLEDTWPTRLENLLNQYRDGKFELINCGFGGYASLNYLNLIRFELIDYFPDIFIIYGGVNDLNIYRNSEGIEAGKAISSIHNFLYYRASMLYTLIVEKVSVIKGKSPVPMFLYANRGVEEYAVNTEKIIRLCKDKNVMLVFVRQMVNAPPDLFMSDEISLEQAKKYSGTENQNNKYLNYLQTYNSAKQAQALRELCLKYQIPLLDFRKDFFESLHSGKELFQDSIHLNAQGYLLLAYLTYQYLVRN